MSKRLGWLLGALVLVAIGVLVACGTTYDASSDGLVLVGSQGSAAIQTFSFNLGSGHLSSVFNSTSSTIASTCLLPGIPSSIVLDPAGAFAYAIVTENDVCTGSATGIMAFKVNSDGTMTAVGNPTPDPNPVALAMDAAGKFLFVAEGLDSSAQAPIPVPCPGTTTQYGVCSYAIANGALTAVPGSFTLPVEIQTPNFAALASTPTVFPGIGLNGVKGGVCAGTSTNPPTSEFLYLADSVNDVVLEFGVDTSTGALTNPPGFSMAQVIATGSVPAGVAVDPCDRFVYVTNNQSNTISAYTICNGLSTQNQNCPTTIAGGDGSLRAVVGSPISLSGGGANLPGPLLVDPFGNTVYVVGTGSNTVSIFRITSVSGGLVPGSPAVVATGLRPTSIAIRSDDSWLFVTNYAAGSLSQYSITPANGSLSPQPAATTDNYPWGVAVK